MDWTDKEVDVIIHSYFEMLKKELSNESYNKSAFRRSIIPTLNSRTHGSVEFKLRNISAVLIEIGAPYIPGYKPAHKYQTFLREEVVKFVAENKISLEKQFDIFSKEMPKKKINLKIDFENFLEKPPIMKSEFREDEPSFIPIKVNYLAKEQNNRNIGEEGERLIIEYEKWRLTKADKLNLADRIEWVSKEKGDGAGFDILSKNENGSDRYIEVKTTKLSKESPIFFSRKENLFSLNKKRDFFLYRVFNFAKSPQMFIKQGSYESFCVLQPQSFKGYF